MKRRPRVFTVRIIPIYMGSTLFFMAFLINAKNHPHIHGEYAVSAPNLIAWSESSPYTWGVRPLTAQIMPVNGIIPIYMGSTRLRSSVI